MSELRAGWVLRWSRAALVAALILGGGLVAHVSAGGLLPDIGILVLLGSATLLGCAALFGRPITTRATVALLALGQAGFHLAMTALAGHAGAGSHAGAGDAIRAEVVRSATAGGRRTGSLRDLMAAPEMPASGDLQLAVPHWAQHVVADLSGANALMALAHLTAAAAVGWWLASGEAALWALICLTGRQSWKFVLLLTAGAGGTLAFGKRHRAASAAVRVERPPARWVIERRPARRGPPRLAAAL
ncbi:hypothetical protein [Nocardioides sp.]|uniref:hypothetical protein n=1 Tax=Nocardioides sp. TaxID=35761 RepID=UPI003D1103A2